MNCNECQDLLSEYVDGELELGGQSKLEHHLADCEPCRAVRDDLLQIVHFSRQLPLHTPAAAVWTRIQEQIDTEVPKTFGARWRAAWGRLRVRDFTLTTPQMALVGLVFLLMFAVSAFLFRNQTAALQDSTAPNQLLAAGVINSEGEELEKKEQAINSLKSIVEQRKSYWSPELQITFDKNMIYVDQFLAECRKQLISNPADETCRELLHNAYDEKMRVLEGFVNF